MSFLERAKQAAGQARQVASEATAQARHAAGDATDRAQATLRDPATQERAKKSLHLARRTMATAVERIDPAILADIVIKATFLQERANVALRKKSSNYRIGTVSIGASIPPSVSFAIVRVGDPRAAEALEGEPMAGPVDEGEHLLPHPSDEPITALDGTQLSDTDLAAPLDLPVDDVASGHDAGLHHSAS